MFAGIQGLICLLRLPGPGWINTCFGKFWKKSIKFDSVVILLLTPQLWNQDYESIAFILNVSVLNRY